MHHHRQTQIELFKRLNTYRAKGELSGQSRKGLSKGPLVVSTHRYLSPRFPWPSTLPVGSTQVQHNNTKTNRTTRLCGKLGRSPYLAHCNIHSQSKRGADSCSEMGQPRLKTRPLQVQPSTQNLLQECGCPFIHNLVPTLWRKEQAPFLKWDITQP